jgi:adenylate kinase
MPNRKDPILEAALLLGPTGSGKTPLGQLLEARGLGGRDCLHFDFGENLRQIFAGNSPDTIVSRTDIERLRCALATGALLEDKDFPIAARILQSFLVRRNAKPDTLILLNGLPRHIGQAESLAKLLRLQTLVQLHCAPATVAKRIAANSGGDRADRTDDDQGAVARKLDIYAQRTAPLVDHLCKQGVTMVRIDATAEMTPAEMLNVLERQAGRVGFARQRSG